MTDEFSLDSSLSSFITPSDVQTVHPPTMARTPPLLLVCLLAVVIAAALLQADTNLRWIWSTSSSSSSSSPSSSSLRLLSNSKRPATIAPGELPGYTGWARPERTSAGYFEIVGCSSCPSSTSSWLSVRGDGIDLQQKKFVATAGQGFHIDIRCSYADCGHSTFTEFYLRAYGPSVITGVAKKMDMDDDCRASYYRLSYYPLDAGSYTVEAVVAFTSPPPMESLPLGNDDDEEPGYEGYLLHEFPLHLEVLPRSSSAVLCEDGAADNLPVCTIDQLPVRTSGMEDDDINMLMKGRWLVTEKARDSLYTEHTLNPHQVSLEGYQRAYNSLGIMMEYQPVGCSLVDDLMDIRDVNSDDVHLIFVGDSVMGLQHRCVRLILESSGCGAKATSIGTHGGLAKRRDGVIEELQQIIAESPNERRVVLFNAGLHDIAQLCSAKYKNARSEYFPLADDEFSCIEVYKTLLYELTSFLASYPAEFVAFQTTSAGWMPYGNFGFAWNPNEYQPYSLSPNAVAHFNEVAMEVVEDASGGRFPIVDGYYITLARPDHREIGEDNAIGKHMVHPGVEVIESMARIWLTAIANVMAER